jgi:GR25 family glycosyltransferase involved in LPS biosynthesis
MGTKKKEQKKKACKKKPPKGFPMTDVFFGKFKSIYCINIEKRTDRKAAAQKVFSALKIENVEFLKVVRDETNGERGCYNEHQRCMQKALAAGSDKCVIFEDDIAVLHKPSDVVCEEVFSFLETNKKWDLMFLGSFPNIYFGVSAKVEGFPNIKQVHSQHAHAYVVSRRFMEFFVNLPYEAFACPVDVLYGVSNKAFAVFPTFFYQTESPSDISASPRFTNGMRKMFVQVKTLYAQHFPLEFLMVNVICVVSLVFLVGLLLLVIFRQRNAKK